MLIDGLLLFSSAQNVTTGDNVSTNVIDLNNARDMGVGTPLLIAAYVVTAFATVDSATLTIQAQGSTDNVTFSTYSQSRAYTAGELAANTKVGFQAWPAVPNLALPRYLRLNYAVGALNFTPGSITSMLVLDRQDERAYPPGIYINN